ncbi:MAG: adenosylcobinamide-GDP ribazoletransferase [Paracoccaceae bacterium]
MALGPDLGPAPPGLVLALQFLTRLPVSSEAEYSEAAMRQSPGWYPAVGIVVGGLSALVFALSALVLPQAMAALLAVGAGLLVTGALHEDGLADLCDGLGGGRGDRARALEIMRDSRIGAFGALGLVMALALRVTALALLPLWVVPPALIAGAVLSRASMTRALAGAAYARAEGAASAVAGEMPEAVLQRAMITGAVAALAAWPFLGFSGGLLGLAGLALAHLALRRLYEPRLGGYTGDCLGAVQVASEIGFLVGLMAGL